MKKKLLGLMGLMGLMGALPIQPIMPINLIHAQDTNRLELRVETRQFFQDNEYFGLHAEGYTLPGFYLRPMVVFNSRPSAVSWKLEAGLHWLHFWGTHNYPTAQSLGVWQQESDTASSVHLLPWMRAEVGAASGEWRVVMGNLRPHDLPLPLYNPERLYAADPEAGVQLQLDYRHFGMDLWVDWREYIWQRSSRQERFTAGLSSSVLWSAFSEQLKMRVPVHVIGQHVGGQGLAEHKPVQNQFNGAVGLIGEYEVANGKCDVEAGCYAMGYTQKHASGIPFKRGWGIYPMASVKWEMGSSELNVDGGYWQGRGFVPLLGSVLFSNVAYVDGITYFGRNRMTNIGASCRWNIAGGELKVEGRWYYYFERNKPSQYSVGVFIDLAPRLTLVK